MANDAYEAAARQRRLALEALAEIAAAAHRAVRLVDNHPPFVARRSRALTAVRRP